MQRQAKAKELIFISQIERDGSGVKPVPEKYINFMIKEDEYFDLIRLSITEKTYIASNFNLFVVKLKREQDESNKTTKA